LKPYAATRDALLVIATSNKTKQGKRVSYSFAEVAAMVGKERTWIYRQVKKGRIRAITGFGTSMIPATEIERIFGVASIGGAQ
jgi:hypothetical protein